MSTDVRFRYCGTNFFIERAYFSWIWQDFYYEFVGGKLFYVRQELIVEGTIYIVRKVAIFWNMRSESFLKFDDPLLVGKTIVDLSCKNETDYIN